MKKSFDRILNENLLKEDNDSTFNKYNNSMLKRMGYKTDNEGKITGQYGRYNSENADANKEKVEKEINNYLNKVKNLKTKYDSKINPLKAEKNKLERIIKNNEGKSPKNNENIGTENNNKDELTIVNDNLKDVNAKINEIDEYINKILKDLNDQLSVDAKKELRLTDRYYETFKPSVLDESFSDISNQEKDLIFGESFYMFQDIVSLEEGGTTMGLASARTVNAAHGHVNSARGLEVKTQNARARGAATASDEHAAKMETKRAENDAIRISTAARHRVDELSGEIVKEDAAAQLSKNIEYKEAGIEKLQMRKNHQNEIIDARIETQKKQLEGLKRSLEVANARQNQAKDAQNQATVTESVKEENNKKISTDSTGKTIDITKLEELTESKDPNRTTFADYSDFTKMLFNGASGDALNYFINGTVNNNNMSEIAVAQYMKANEPELEPILKKINFYLRRTSSGLTYEQYIDLKVQKGKFKSLFNENKKKYNDRYKIK